MSDDDGDNYDAVLQVVCGWARNGSLAVTLTVRTLKFLDSPNYLRLDVDRLLSVCSLKKKGVGERSLALAAICLMVSIGVERVSE